MKVKSGRHILAALLMLALTLLISGCSNRLNNPNKPNVTSPERYDNPLSGSSFENSWGDDFGIRDPYIIKYNGSFYMYISTPNNGLGVKMYKSDDLMNWTYGGNVFNVKLADEITDEVNRTDSEDKAHGALAPEVYYWNGYFYMYTSITKGSGNPVGHFIYRATKPEGPYTKQTKNLGMYKDGTVFIDDDEKMYFITAGDKAGRLNLYKMRNMTTINGVKEEIILDETNTVNYTAPFLFKDNGVYYLNYSQTVDNDHQIDYSYSKSLDVTKFTTFEKDPLLSAGNLSLSSLGHNVVFTGPDLVNRYTLFTGESKSLNLAPVKVDGQLMFTDGRISGNIAPKLPDFVAVDHNSENYETLDNKLLSKTVTATDYVAEFNFTDKPNIILSYKDASNYLKLVIEAKKLTLIQYKAGKQEVLAEGTITSSFSYVRLHTIRVEKRQGNIAVYFDNMKKISTPVSVSGGRIGYGFANTSVVKYTAYTNITTENSQINYAPGAILAREYLPDYSNLKDSKINNTDELYSLILDEGNYATYLVDFAESGTYKLVFTYNNQSKARKIYLSVDGKDYVTLHLPKRGEGVVTLSVHSQEFSQGIHSLTIAAKKEFQFSAIQIIEKE